MSMRRTCSNIYLAVNNPNPLKALLIGIFNKKWMEYFAKCYSRAAPLQTNHLQQCRGTSAQTRSCPQIFSPPPRIRRQMSERQYSKGMKDSLANMIGLNVGVKHSPKVMKKPKKPGSNSKAIVQGPEETNENVSSGFGPQHSRRHQPKMETIKKSVIFKPKPINQMRKPLVKRKNIKSNLGGSNKIVKMPYLKEGPYNALARLQKYLGDLSKPVVPTSANVEKQKGLIFFELKKQHKVMSKKNPHARYVDARKILAPKPIYCAGKYSLMNSIKLSNIRHNIKGVSKRKTDVLNTGGGPIRSKSPRDHKNALFKFLMTTMNLDEIQTRLCLKGINSRLAMDLGVPIFRAPKQKREALSKSLSSNTVTEDKCKEDAVSQKSDSKIYEKTENKNDQTVNTTSTAASLDTLSRKSAKPVSEPFKTNQFTTTTITPRSTTKLSKAKITFSHSKITSTKPKDDKKQQLMEKILKISQELDTTSARSDHLGGYLSAKTTTTLTMEGQKSNTPLLLLPPPDRPDLPVIKEKVLPPPPNREDEILATLSSKTVTPYERTGQNNNKKSEKNPFLNLTSSNTSQLTGVQLNNQLGAKTQVPASPPIIRNQRESLYTDFDNSKINQSMIKQQFPKQPSNKELPKKSDKKASGEDVYGQKQLVPPRDRADSMSMEKQDDRLAESSNVGTESGLKQVGESPAKVSGMIANPYLKNNLTSGSVADWSPKDRDELSLILEQRNIRNNLALAKNQTSQTNFSRITQAENARTKLPADQRSNDDTSRSFINVTNEGLNSQNIESEASKKKATLQTKDYVDELNSILGLKNPYLRKIQTANVDDLKSKEKWRSAIPGKKIELKPLPDRPDIKIDEKKHLKPPPDRPVILKPAQPKWLKPPPDRPKIMIKPKRVALNPPPSRPDMKHSSPLKPQPNRPDDWEITEKDATALMKKILNQRKALTTTSPLSKTQKSVDSNARIQIDTKIEPEIAKTDVARDKRLKPEPDNGVIAIPETVSQIKQEPFPKTAKQVKQSFIASLFRMSTGQSKHKTLKKRSNETIRQNTNNIVSETVNKTPKDTISKNLDKNKTDSPFKFDQNTGKEVAQKYQAIDNKRERPVGNQKHPFGPSNFERPVDHTKLNDAEKKLKTPEPKQSFNNLPKEFSANIGQNQAVPRLDTSKLKTNIQNVTSNERKSTPNFGSENIQASISKNKGIPGSSPLLDSIKTQKNTNNTNNKTDFKSSGSDGNNKSKKDRFQKKKLFPSLLGSSVCSIIFNTPRSPESKMRPTINFFKLKPEVSDAENTNECLGDKPGSASLLQNQSQPLSNGDMKDAGNTPKVFEQTTKFQPTIGTDMVPYLPSPILFTPDTISLHNAPKAENSAPVKNDGLPPHNPDPLSTLEKSLLPQVQLNQPTNNTQYYDNNNIIDPKQNGRKQIEIILNSPPVSTSEPPFKLIPSPDPILLRNSVQRFKINKEEFDESGDNIDESMSVKKTSSETAVPQAPNAQGLRPIDDLSPEIPTNSLYKSKSHLKLGRESLPLPIKNQNQQSGNSSVKVPSTPKHKLDRTFASMDLTKHTKKPAHQAQASLKKSKSAINLPQNQTKKSEPPQLRLPSNKQKMETRDTLFNHNKKLPNSSQREPPTPHPVIKKLPGMSSNTPLYAPKKPSALLPPNNIPGTPSTPGRISSKKTNLSTGQQFSLDTFVPSANKNSSSQSSRLLPKPTSINSSPNTSASPPKKSSSPPQRQLNIPPASVPKKVSIPLPRPPSGPPKGQSGRPSSSRSNPPQMSSLESSSGSARPPISPPVENSNSSRSNSSSFFRSPPPERPPTPAVCPPKLPSSSVPLEQAQPPSAPNDTTPSFSPEIGPLFTPSLYPPCPIIIPEPKPRPRKPPPPCPPMISTPKIPFCNPSVNNSSVDSTPKIQVKSQSPKKDKILDPLPPNINVDAGKVKKDNIFNTISNIFSAIFTKSSPQNKLEKQNTGGNFRTGQITVSSYKAKKELEVKTKFAKESISQPFPPLHSPVANNSKSLNSSPAMHRPEIKPQIASPLNVSPPLPSPPLPVHRPGDSKVSTSPSPQEPGQCPSSPELPVPPVWPPPPPCPPRPPNDSPLPHFPLKGSGSSTQAANTPIPSPRVFPHPPAPLPLFLNAKPKVGRLLSLETKDVLSGDENLETSLEKVDNLEKAFTKSKDNEHEGTSNSQRDGVLVRTQKLKLPVVESPYERSWYTDSMYQPHQTFTLDKPKKEKKLASLKRNRLTN